ncbi:LacI family DNA-binding transcriptional regulator [Microbulbifer hydrolyticus]|uniref:LacI family transcriptional regulator n=1 Tax=Microbulbifer hydrolyticus TaxID=48074 RepID=A0A6P1TEW1_9GAMM|nr:LacI family DNA-binding transcriptional regulator [Microbulbifer hydrolyticus]MBB5212579.1 LacI family transcriptional regulator [Microbulbifer hydrolyticus]QHQ40196.1 substrate-binding domain-containing protein [Microbulbifer hydrolyticus]
MKPKQSRRQGSGPTIADVAREAGVSPMTVSRVINGEDNVRARTRETVNAAIKSLGYTPNSAARSLAGGAQIKIGLLHSHLNASYLSAFLIGALEQSSRYNIQLVVEHCDVELNAEAVVARMLSGGVEAVLLPPPLSDLPAVLEVLESSETPAVLMAAEQPRNNISVVKIDDYQAAYEMTRHIASLGHRRIGYITGDRGQQVSQRRLEGYRQALKDSGLTPVDELIEEGIFTYRSGLAGAEKLLNLKQPPTAVFASNDEMAAATVSVAQRRGLDVPRDLTVCGFDDTALATTIWPELTTIHQPVVDMSRAAVDLLVKKVRAMRAGEAENGQQVQLDFTLIRRRSDAPPKS